MYSKLVRCLSLIFALFAMAGCDLPLNETPPEPKPIEVSLGETTGCLSRVMPVMKVYFEGKAQNAQLEATWSCVSTALDTFEKSVQGRYEDRFTSRELAHFIEQYFLADGERLPDPLVLEVFRIKQLFVGGATGSITRTEMKNLGQVILQLKQITLDLNPYMNVLVQTWDAAQVRDLNNNHFEDANAAIQKAAKDLALIIEKNGMPYRLEYVSNLLRQVEGFTHSGWTWIADIEKALPVIEKIKKALAGGDEDEIAPTEWRQFALLGARGYVQYLRYHYFIENKNWSSGGSQFLAYFTKSIGDLFSYLGDMVDGKPEKKLTSEELVGMLKSITLLMPKVKVSEELVLELMKIKVVFFGGRIDYFEKADFDRAQGKLETFQGIAEIFLKYEDVYTSAWKPDALPADQAHDFFLLAEMNLEDLASRIASIMENGYDLQNVVTLAEEIEKLYPPGPDATSLVVTANKYLPTVVVVKNIIFSDHNSVVGDLHSPQSPSEQWRNFLTIGSKAYSQFLYYEYFMQKKPLLTGAGLSGLEVVTLKALDILDGVIAQKQSGDISLVEISRLCAALLRADIVPQKISQNSLDQISKILVQKILITPEDRLSAAADSGAHPLPEGLSKASTKVLRAEFALWLENQKLLDGYYRKVSASEGKSGPALLEDLENTTPKTVGSQELQMIYSSPLPLSFDSMGRWFLASPPKNYLRKTSDLINIVRTAVRVVIRSYAGEMARIQNYQGVTLDEAQALYSDVKPVLVDIGMIHPSNKDFAENRFRDANLFTSVGNGDDYADFRELSDLFVMIVSGLKLDSMMFQKYEKSVSAHPECAVTKPTIYNDDWTTNLQCVLDFYAQEMPSVFVSMPDFMTYQATLDKAKFESMFMNFLKSAGHITAPAGQPPVTLVHVGHLALVPHVIQYVEAFFQTYDANHDSILQTEEAMAAFPIYRPILQKVSKLKTEKELRGLFSWMLKNGKPPATLVEKLQFTAWCQKAETSWKVEADRSRLAGILGFIAEALQAAANGTPIPGITTGSGPTVGPGTAPTPGAGTTPANGNSGANSGTNSGADSGANTGVGSGTSAGAGDGTASGGTNPPTGAATP